MSAVEVEVNREPGPLDECEGDFWDECSLTVVRTDPPRYELKLPQGLVLRLRVGHWFDVTRFTMAYVDVVGAFPPLPSEKPGGFLKELFQRLLEDRRDVEVAEEASDRGTLLGDIRLGILACPQTDDPRDIDRGNLFSVPDGEGAWLSGRSLLARVARACPVRFTPGDFYAALTELGLTNLGPRRHDGWQGRVWLVPSALLPTVTVMPAPRVPPKLNGHTNGTTTPAQADLPGIPAESERDVEEPGAFDDLL